VRGKWAWFIRASSSFKAVEGTEMDEEGLAARSLGRIDPGRQGTPVVGVVVVKIVYMAAVFYAYAVSKTLPAAVFLFALKASSAVGFVLLQKPFTSGKRLSRTTWVRVGRYSLLVLLTSLLWCVGLSLCGPLRTVLLSEHSDLALGALLSILACTHTQGKGRGAVFFLLGVMCLLLFDNDHSAIPLEHRILNTEFNEFYRLAIVSMNPL
jgi:hypothetical protein